MPNPAGSIGRRATAAACLILVSAGPAAPQEPLPNPPASREFLSRYACVVMLASLDSDDNRFSWDAHIGANLDVLDYVVGRVSLLGDYEVVMGNEQQLFDPNQARYTLQASSSFRARSTELAAVFRHESRHLSDRANRQGIAMNVLGGRLLRQIPAGRVTVDVRVDVGRVVMRTYVDYTWIASAELAARRPLSARVGLLGRAIGERYGVDPAIAGRDTQHGGRLEGGVRIAGEAAALELFAGYERVVDADPLARLPRRWVFGGIRVVN